MSFLHVCFFSNVLKKQVHANVLFPDGGKAPFPVYYLLHGLSDDYSIWHRRTSIERYCEKLPLIVVMPDGFRGFYTDNAEGPPYGQYIMEDVIGFTERTFPARSDRSGRCIGGLSMGGYGALRLALSHPETFVSANSHSGAMVFGHDEPRMEDPEFRRMFGKTPIGSAHDLFALAGKFTKKRGLLPKLKIDCGTADHQLEPNRRFIAHLKELKVPHDYAEFPGEHNWAYWDEHIREALAFHCQAMQIKPLA